MSTSIPEAALSIAGLTLAHAVWNVSDLPAGEGLVPLAFVEEGEGLKLVRFEADTQEEAIAAGVREASDWTSQGKAWAFARDGIIRENGLPIDVLTVDLWGVGLKERITLLQKYRPFADPDGFRLLGGIQVAIDQSLVAAPATEEIVAGVLRGVASHPKASEEWKRWQ